MTAYKLNCGCVVQFERGIERVIDMCACCDKEFTDRHLRAAADRSTVRNPAPAEQVPA